MPYIAASDCNKHFIHGMSTYLAAGSLFPGQIIQSSETSGHCGQGKFDTKSAFSPRYIYSAPVKLLASVQTSYYPRYIHQLPLTIIIDVEIMIIY
jgi:hypothetical protein